MLTPTLPDAQGLYWQIPSYLVDWTNHLILDERQGPDWSFSAILSSFDTLPGDLAELLTVYLGVETIDDTLQITMQFGRWTSEAAVHPLGKANLYRSVCKNLLYLPGWRSLGGTRTARILGLPEDFEGPWLGDEWQIGDTPLVEIACR